MQNSGMETSVLPLVARCVSSAQSAQTATAGEGADLLMLQVNREMESSAEEFVKEVCGGVSIPVLLDISGSGVARGLNLLQEGADGLVLTAAEIREPGYVESLVAEIGLAIEKRKEMETSHSPDMKVPFTDDLGVDVEDGGAFLGLPDAADVDMEDQSVKKLVKKIVNEERVLLTAMVEFVKEASPDVSCGG